MKSTMKRILNDQALSPENILIFAHFKEALDDGMWDDSLNGDYINCFYQVYRQPEISDIWAAALMHSYIAEEKIFVVTINVGDTPSADVAIDANNAKLCNIPKPFDAEFIPQKGHGAHSDGYIEWSSDIIPETYPIIGGKTMYYVAPAEMLPTPLEVGYTRGHITFFHLLTSGAVARWPYGTQNIYLFIAQSGGLSRYSFPAKRGATFSIEYPVRPYKLHHATPIDIEIASQTTGLNISD